MNVLKSVNPYTQKEIRSIEELSDGALLKQVEKSVAVFRSYRETDFSHRKDRMLKVSQLLRERKLEYAKLITSEMGKLIGESVSEIEKCAWVCEYYAENAEQFLQSRYEETDAGESYLMHQPIGTVLAVMPWNFPFWQVFRFAAPNLMAGNTALLKHASNVQGCAEAIETVIRDAGFDEGVFSNLSISSSKVEQVINHPGVKAVTLTGSEPAGAAVASAAAKKIKKSVLELGGNNAFVVLNDADIDAAVETAFTARMINCGQSCIAAKRFIIEKDIYDPFLSKLHSRVEKLQPGDPSLDDTNFGPLFSKVQADEIEHQVQDSIEKGATKDCGGEKKDAFYSPVILTNVTLEMKVFREETFGPVFAVVSVDSKEEALELSNDSSFGLGMQVFTRSDDSAEYFIRNADEGSVFVNGLVKSDPRLPFGGVKRSGFGRELSKEGILEFMNVKTIWKK